MAGGLRIDKGPIDAMTPPHELAPSEWKILTCVRRGYLAVHLPSDCRRLLSFVEDAELLFRECGFKDIDDYIRNGLELDPEQVGWAIEGLRRMKPNEPIPYAKAIELGKHGGDRRSEKVKDQGDNVTLKERGNSRDYILARLDRDGQTALAAKVRSGELSAHAAAIEAGFRKQATSLERTLKLLPKMTRVELQQLRARVDQLLEQRSEPSAIAEVRRSGGSSNGGELTVLPWGRPPQRRRN